MMTGFVRATVTSHKTRMLTQACTVHEYRAGIGFFDKVYSNLSNY